MNKVSKIVVATVLATAMALPVTNLLASGTHSNEHAKKMMEFDDTDTEFGMYRADMKATKIIEIGMSDDMRFTPNMITVKKGDVVMFKHKNHGKIMHEFVLGTPKSLDQHAEMMKKFPTMEHEEPYMAHVAPGESGSILWKFSSAGEFAFGCLVPGHYDAGMRGSVIVGS